ncbi:MAG TPA: proton-conducting transporter membrane subunit [Acidimicrobiales bacterium]|nr:proton-conducting transporter membrane subunit [Acidimicrobiales bacterium]
MSLTGALGGAALPRPWRVPVSATLIATACVVESVAAIDVLATGQTANWHSSQVLPLTGASLALTPLGAIFVVLVALVAVPAAIYWIGYAPHGMSARPTAGSFAVFITGLLIVPAAASVATFMFLWEMMALTSLALVLTDQGRREAARSAGVWYGVITHVGAAFILAAFLILAAHSGGQSFTALESHARALAPGVRATIFLLALVGFGSKAGVVPFHVWLPKAHPEAPSPVSALMSGAMVALGVYGIVLFGDVLLGGGPVWWWLIVLTLGAVSALFGSLHAANSTDLKKLLAYSTTDNIGLVLLALGASGLFSATGHARLGALSLVAALVLLVNHAMFKGALFLAAGSVQVATGTRDLDELGGLLRRMPQTGALFLVAAASICAMPPLNGFVGEWLLFQSLLHGVNLGNTAGDIAIPVAVAALALTAGLTIVAFVKATGVGFLGRPRSPGAEVALEVPLSMRMSTGLLVTMCVVAGVAPMVILPAVERAVRAALPGVGSAPLVHGVRLQLVSVRGVLAPTVLAVSLVVAVAVVVFARRALARRRVVRVTEVWGCGRELVTARMQYTATSFAEPVQRVFDDVLRPVRDIDVSHVAESRYVIESMSYRSHVNDQIENALYLPVIRAIRRWGQFARRLQPGSVHRYLAYGLVALVVTLVVVAVLG